MADRDFASIVNALAKTWGPLVRRALNSRAIGLMTLLGGGAENRVGRGKNVTESVELDGESAETYSDGADATSYTTNVVVTPTLPWGLYRANGKVTNLARDVAGTSVGPGDLVRLAGRELMNKSRALALKLGMDFYSGSGSNSLIGLDTALQDANVYAGIDRALGVHAKFRAKVIDPGAPTAITKALIRDDIARIYDNGGEYPTLALCHTDVWLKIAALFDSNVQYQIATDREGRVQLQGGVEVIRFNGCTFVQDRLATNGRIYYLTPESFVFEVLPKVAASEIGDIDLGTMPVEMTGGELPLGMYLEPLARTGAAQKFSAYVTAQMLCVNPIQNGVRLNVQV
jgi:hypothetical protein